MEGKIALKGMEFHSYHGVYDYEKEKGNIFHIDVAFQLDISKAAQSDSIEDTLDYVAVYRVISEVMEKPVNLLEHLAYMLTQRLLSEFSQADTVEITVSKEAPPVGGICRESVVTLSRSRLS